MMTKVIITQEWIKIVKILFIHSKYWTIHCSLTHTHPNSNTHPIQKHSPSSKTLSISHLSLKTEKTCTPQHYSAHTQTHLLQNTHWWEQSSQLILVRTKFSTVSDDDQSHHHSGMNKIVKILFIHSKYWTIHCSLTHIHPIQTLTKILLELKT